MKLSKNFFKALKSSQMFSIYIMFILLVFILAIYPPYSWLVTLVYSIFPIASKANSVASGIDNDTEIIEDKE